MSNYSISPADFWTVVFAFCVATGIVTYHLTKIRLERRNQSIHQAACKRATYLS